MIMMTMTVMVVMTIMILMLATITMAWVPASGAKQQA